MPAALIPCPVCGGKLTANGHGRALKVDCPDRHRATTDPVLYEVLRRHVVTDAVDNWFGTETAPEPACADEPRGVVVKGLPEIPVHICTRCLTLAILPAPR